MIPYESIQNKAIQECMKYKQKKYTHFDLPLGKNQKQKLLHNLKYNNHVTTFRHLPFVKFDIKFNKYKIGESGEKGHIVPKIRKIALPSHHDTLLLKYYAEILSPLYENYLSEHNFENVPVAYRTGKSNISGAKEVFDFLWSHNDCWIIKGDFSSFFDNLNHQIIFKNVKKVLSQYFFNGLPEDWISVLNFIAKYRAINKRELKIHDGKYAKNLKQLSKDIHQGKIHISSKNVKGIPQGTAISATLANVYMLEFDELVNAQVLKCGGIYRRYSDDFAIVIPKKEMNQTELQKFAEYIITLSQNKILLSIKKEKTAIYQFDKTKRMIFKKDSKVATNFDYLGFSFTGKTVYLRSKTIYKYHYRGKHAIHLLIRNMREYRLVKSKNYLSEKERYLSKRSPESIQKIESRLALVKHDAEKGYSLHGRKKITYMYLVNRPIPKRNMLYYAQLAQEQLSKPIIGCDSLYNVNILSKVKKQIGQFQQIFHSLK